MYKKPRRPDHPSVDTGNHDLIDPSANVWIAYRSFGATSGPKGNASPSHTGSSTLNNCAELVENGP
jgi:hypothetical protein